MACACASNDMKWFCLGFILTHKRTHMKRLQRGRHNALHCHILVDLRCALCASTCMVRAFLISEQTFKHLSPHLRRARHCTASTVSRPRTFCWKLRSTEKQTCYLFEEQPSDRRGQLGSKPSQCTPNIRQPSGPKRVNSPPCSWIGV